MTPERREIPDWAKKERDNDLVWIGENINIFWNAAKKAFNEQGRGVILVDTTSQSLGEGNPFVYASLPDIEKLEDEDTSRMVQEYDPQTEIVILLWKSEEQTSTYRVRALKR